MSLIITLPAEMEIKLRERAAQEGESIEDFVYKLVEREVLETFNRPASRLPDFIPTDEISAPCDLPRSSQPVAVTYMRIGLPAPLETA